MSHQSPPQANSEEYFAFLLPNVLYDGGVVVYELCHIECVGGNTLEYISVNRKHILRFVDLCSLTQYI